MLGDDAPLLVVGAGPAGMVAAMLLADLGVPVLVVDKRLHVSALPRARGIHARATEVLRQLRIESDMVAQALPIDSRMEVRSTLVDAPLAVASTGGSTWTEVSPCDGIAIAQDDFESVLRTHLLQRDRVIVALGVELVAMDIAGGAVSATLTDRSSGAVTTVTPRFVIGADGWRSDTRRLLNVALAGEDDLGSSRAVYFRGDLSGWLGSPPAAFVTFPSSRAVLMPTHRDHRWVTMQTGQDHSPVSPGQFVTDILGVDVDVEVLGDGMWTAAVQQAERFSVGPVFLIGDAAHRVTPAGASGISSAMADAHNVAWKIAAVLQGWGDPHLLDSYAVERSAVAHDTGQMNRAAWAATFANRAPNLDLRLLDMGYLYDSDIISAPSPAGSAPAWSQATSEGSESAYRPTARPGARAPHAWINVDGQRLSTLDLFGHGFVILTDEAGAAWTRAVRARATQSALPITAATLDPAAATIYGLASGEAVLIRPDGHVAWRSGAPPPKATALDAADQLTQALTTSTGHAGKTALRI